LRLRERKKDTESRKRRERRGERRTDGDNLGRKQPSPPRREKGCGLKRARCWDFFIHRWAQIDYSLRLLNMTETAIYTAVTPLKPLRSGLKKPQ
jgi:hypothetical protein